MESIKQMERNKFLSADSRSQTPHGLQERTGKHKDKSNKKRYSISKPLVEASIGNNQQRKSSAAFQSLEKHLPAVEKQIAEI